MSVSWKAQPEPSIRLEQVQGEFPSWRIWKGAHGWYADAPQPMVSATNLDDLRVAIKDAIVRLYYK